MTRFRNYQIYLKINFFVWLYAEEILELFLDKKLTKNQGCES